LQKLVMKLVLGLALGEFPVMAAADDQYIQGYATAILEQLFQARGDSLQVTNGVISVRAAELKPADRENIIKALQQIRGVARVEVVEAAPGPQPPVPDEAPRERPLKLEESKPHGGVFLPSGRLFEPLIADPYWPRFSVAYQQYLGDDELKNVSAVNLGATLAIYEGDFFAGGRWQAGLQGNVSSFFDLDAPSADLVNADYLAGLPITYRLGNFSALARVFHQSSHLGDEFLLRTRTSRINLSYEAVDGVLSYELFKSTVRVYGGGGFLVGKDPKDLKPWSAQGGVEFHWPRAFLGNLLRPLAGVDLRSREETDWDLDASARVGLQLETANLRGRYFQLMVEYYNGHSPHGQFFERIIQYWGVGLHFYFD
jgi:hypothetical protein